ncbi:MAG: DEAD/DEAH box helicase family protein [Peptococcaceae bacterium]|nr:DEAD/DEAH box helicase family protein [Peptococcaceae bacterium]
MAFLEDYSFVYPWRDYQTKILKDLETHMQDNKIHLVAAPGAGKTVLGLEIVRRLNQNVLILAPTITIKNQWVERFVNLFVSSEPEPGFISTDIYNLDRFNVATYQALYYAHHRRRIYEGFLGEEENDQAPRPEHFDYDLIGRLKDLDIRVIVLDEAHHLRAAWWKSLTDVLKILDGVTTVALTATPPYDAERREWDKYMEICGPIDSEITVPELVATGDLCAHQDFVIFNALSPEEETRVSLIAKALAEFVADLESDQPLIRAIACKPEFTDYAAHEDVILSNPQYYSSLLVYLNNVGLVPNNKELWEAARALGGGAPVPAVTVTWLEIMLRGLLYDDKAFIAANKEIVRGLRSRLIKIGGIVKGNISLEANDEIKRIMAGSIGKMNSIADIVLNEHGALGQDLSMVILTDYVRGDALKTGQPKTSDIGAIPIFLRLLHDIGVTPHADSTVTGKIPNIAVLSGKLKIVPKTLIPHIQDRIATLSQDRASIPCSFHDVGIEGYVAMKTNSKYENAMVGLVTDLMNEKRIQIIIGTVALLGEGWDCQAINSLILASYVGSFMLSNQMRGRAIRSNDAKDKVSNVWHLASLTKDDFENFSDYTLLERRFKSFLGIAYNADEILNGIDRLDVLQNRNLLSEYEAINKQMYRLSRTRRHTKNRWSEILSLFGGESIQIAHTLKSDMKREMRFKPVIVSERNRTLGVGLAACTGWVLSAVILTGLPTLTQSIGSTILLILLGTGLLSAKFFRNLVQTIRHISPAKNISTISGVVLAALRKQGIITSKTAVKSVNKTTLAGSVTYETSLHQSTAYENSIFIQCIREIFERVDNPRYLIALENKKGTSGVYFCVPSVFSDSKAKAEMFFALWQEGGVLGKSTCRLVYTRSAEGRKILLRARKGSFDYSNRFSEQQKPVLQKSVRNRRWL